MRKKLEFQADRIETVLTMHKVPARVTGGTVTPRWIRFQVLPAVGAKISKIKRLDEELAAALDAPNCRISRRGAAVAVEVPRDDPQPVRFLSLYRQLETDDPPAQGRNNSRSPGSRTGGTRGIPPVTAILGLAEDGAPLLIRLPSPDVAHILVAGMTGSGKTVLLKAIILSLALCNSPPTSNQAIQNTNATGLALCNNPPTSNQAVRNTHSTGLALCNNPPTSNQAVRNTHSTGLAMTDARRDVSMVLIDPRGSAFDAFMALPHLARPVIREVEETTEALCSLVHLMERRGDGDVDEPRVVVFIDELADLLMTGKEGVQEPLTRLLQRGRGAGIHVVAATQKPTSAVLGSLIKANFPVRLVGKVTSATDARVASGWSGTGAERLQGRGDFIAVAEGRVMRFQAAYVAPEEIREVVARLAPGTPPSLSPLSPEDRSCVPIQGTALSDPLRRLTKAFKGG